MQHPPRRVVCGVGNGGTLTGLSHYFAKTAPKVEIVLADPAGSDTRRLREDGKGGAAKGGWLVEGIGGDSIPPWAISRTLASLHNCRCGGFQTCREL